MSSKPAPLSRREKRQLELRRRILDATVQLVKEEDINGIAVEHICTEADVARKTFYNYFANKQEVVFALCDELLFQRSERLLKAALDDPAVTLEAFLRGYLQQAGKSLTEYSAVDRQLIAQVMGESASSERVQAHLAFLRHGFARMVERGQASGEVSEAFGANLYATVVLSSMNGMISGWASRNDYPIAEVLAELGDFLLQSMCRPAAS